MNATPKTSGIRDNYLRDTAGAFLQTVANLSAGTGAWRQETDTVVTALYGVDHKTAEPEP